MPPVTARNPITAMKSHVRLAFATLALAFAAATTTIAAEPGYVDFGKLVGPAKGDFVNVSLGKGVLKLASLVTKCKNPEAAQLVSGLSRVRVSVVGLDETNRESTTE